MAEPSCRDTVPILSPSCQHNGSCSGSSLLLLRKETPRGPKIHCDVFMPAHCGGAAGLQAAHIQEGELWALLLQSDSCLGYFQVLQVSRVLPSLGFPCVQVIQVGPVSELTSHRVNFTGEIILHFSLYSACMEKQ